MRWSEFYRISVVSLINEWRGHFVCRSKIFHYSFWLSRVSCFQFNPTGLNFFQATGFFLFAFVVVYDFLDSIFNYILWFRHYYITARCSIFIIIDRNMSDSFRSKFSFVCLGKSQMISLLLFLLFSLSPLIRRTDYVWESFVEFLVPCFVTWIFETTLTGYCNKEVLCRFQTLNEEIFSFQYTPRPSCTKNYLNALNSKYGFMLWQLKQKKISVGWVGCVFRMRVNNDERRIGVSGSNFPLAFTFRMS